MNLRKMTQDEGERIDAIAEEVSKETNAKIDGHGKPGEWSRNFHARMEEITIASGLRVSMEDLLIYRQENK